MTNVFAIKQSLYAPMMDRPSRKISPFSCFAVLKNIEAMVKVQKFIEYNFRVQMRAS